LLDTTSVRILDMSPNDPQIKVVLADDHPLLREGFSNLLELTPDISVVGEADDPGMAAKLNEKWQPDVLVLDIRFQSEKTGIDLAQEILKKNPNTRIVIFSQYDQDEIIKKTYAVGAMAFVAKNSDPNELITAIRKAKAGDIYFPPEIAKRLAYLSTQTLPLERLSKREVDVLKNIASGHTNNEIVETLGISLSSVTKATASVKEKLELKSTAELVKFAIKNNIISL